MALLCCPGTVDSPSDQQICRRIEAEFREMPGLTLTLPQAARLFGVEAEHCERLLRSLVRAGVLTTDGPLFARRDAGRRCA